MAKLHDLVIHDGYYAIVTGNDEIFLCNGLRVVLESLDIWRMEALPIYASRAVPPNPLDARANFTELFRMPGTAAPSAASVRQIAEELNGGPLPEKAKEFMLEFFAYAAVRTFEELYPHGRKIDGRQA